MYANIHALLDTVRGIVYYMPSPDYFGANKMPSSEQARKSAIEYHNSQLLKIVKSMNPDYPLGDGMIASIKHHREQLAKLGA